MEINGGGGGGANKLDSQNLRDLLRIKQENYQNDLRAAVSVGRNSLTGITLDALLSEERSHVPPVINEPPQQQRLQSNRTLLDVIRDESEAATRRDNTRRWRHFKSKLRLRRNQSLPASGIVSNNHINNRIMIEAEERRGMREEEEEEERQPARMSLMELLEETDKKMEYSMSEEVEAAEIVGGEVEYNNCCVCMVRNKGSAFIPCGHTFCRLCSRELWVQRGSCPICNNSIVEILDIF